MIVKAPILENSFCWICMENVKEFCSHYCKHCNDSLKRLSRKGGEEMAELLGEKPFIQYDDV